MMGFYHPCHNCVREKAPCARRDAVAVGIKGLGLTSARFRCAERVPVFTVGQRVSVTWLVPDVDGHYGDEATAESWPATVVAERKPKFQIVVDDVRSDYETPARSYIKNDSLYCKVTAAKLAPLDEPRREVCGTCQGVLTDGTVPGCFGYVDGPHSYEPFGCLKAKLPLLDAQGGVTPAGDETGTGSVAEGDSTRSPSGDAPEPFQPPEIPEAS